MTGMSRRQYAKSRGISESAVRKHIKSGVLVGALLPDGTLDPGVADAALKASRTRGAAVPVSLQAARSRRERALARQDMDTLHRLEASVVNPLHFFTEWLPAAVQATEATFRTLSDRALPLIAGQDAAQINATLKSVVNDLLNETSAAAHNRAEQIRAEKPDEPEPDIDAMTPVQLEAFRAETQARRLEVERHVRKGLLRYADDMMREVAEAVAVAKSLLLAIPARTDTQLASASPDKARALLDAEVDLVVGALSTPTKRFRQSLAA